VALTLDEKIEMHRESIRVLLGAVRAAREELHYPRTATNYGIVFSTQLLLAVLQWRTGTGDPRPTLSDAVATARESRGVLRELGGADLWRVVDYGSAALLTFLLEGEFDADLRAELPPPAAFATIKAQELETALLAVLVARMADGVAPPEGIALMERASAMKRVDLLVASHAKYQEIVEACTAGASIEPLVRDAEALFLKRKRNSFYAGGSQSRGGGPDNDFTVDYVLGTVLEWCRRQGAPPVETIHAWR
jgi:hypothetical protein